MWILSALPSIGIISPLIFMFVAKDRDFVYRNTMQCLAFQILLIIIWVVIAIIGVITCGVGFMLVIIPAVLQIVVGIIGAITANNGAVYAPPVSSSLARAWFKV